MPVELRGGMIDPAAGLLHVAPVADHVRVERADPVVGQPAAPGRGKLLFAIAQSLAMRAVLRVALDRVRPVGPEIGFVDPVEQVVGAGETAHPREIGADRMALDVGKRRLVLQARDRRDRPAA